MNKFALVLVLVLIVATGVRWFAPAQLEAATKAALEQLGMDATIDHVTDFSAIAAYGVMTTPALVVNGKVVSYGKVLKVEEAVALLSKERDGE